MRDFASLNKMPPRSRSGGRPSIQPRWIGALQVVDLSIIRQIKAVVKRSQGVALGFSPALIYRDKDPSGGTFYFSQPAYSPDGFEESFGLAQIPATLVLLHVG